MLLILATLIFVFFVVFSLISIKSSLSQIKEKLGIDDLPNLSDEEIKRGIEEVQEQDFFNHLNK